MHTNDNDTIDSRVDNKILISQFKIFIAPETPGEAAIAFIVWLIMSIIILTILHPYIPN
ncbi:MAG: hypothetical protein WC346_02200 [Methanogenium sp.]|jgi:hypothetical protein